MIAITSGSQRTKQDHKDGKLDESKQRYCQKTDARTLADVIKGADVFLGCSAPGVMTPEMVKTMADKPVILALANPEPEIRPELAQQARPDCIIATGRSDYPNQVNNVLCFPYIFRGALDCGATKINEAMKPGYMLARSRMSSTHSSQNRAAVAPLRMVRVTITEAGGVSGVGSEAMGPSTATRFPTSITDSTTLTTTPFGRGPICLSLLVGTVIITPFLKGP